MVNDEKPLTPDSEKDAENAPRNPRILRALGELLLPPIPDSDADQEGSAIEAQRHSNSSTLARATGMPSETNPEPGAGLTAAGTFSGFHRLIERIRAFERDEQVHWQCRFRKVRELGRGGQGIVHLVECLNEHSGPRALKVFSPEPYGDAQLYFDEMRRMQHVTSLVDSIDNENLVSVERFGHFGDSRGLHMMVMKCIDGHDLRWMVDRRLLERLRGSLSEARRAHLEKVVITNGETQSRLKTGIAVKLIQDCLQGLDALHRRGIVHGDVKPSNIMVNCFGNAKLIDLGSAFELASPPRNHTWTPRYAAPEFLDNLQSRKWSPQSDLASLGFVLIELLAGRPAIFGHASDDSTRTGNNEIDDELIEAKWELPESLPDLLPDSVRRFPVLVELCQRLIAPDPNLRIRTAREAITGPVGTVRIGYELVRGNLATAFSQEIQQWIEDVKSSAGDK